jgi:hypothetical protein
MWMAGRMWGFLVLLVLSLLVMVAFVHIVVKNEQVQVNLLVILLFIGLAWLTYTRLPSPVKRVISSLRRKNKGHGR